MSLNSCSFAQNLTKSAWVLTNLVRTDSRFDHSQNFLIPRQREIHDFIRTFNILFFKVNTPHCLRVLQR